jgi:Restriction Enzyme Adenine Methylase Associated
MSQFQEKLTQLKLLMESLKQELSPFFDKANFNEKQSQLKSIEKTILQLQKTITPVPEELRQLKFKLLKELDAFADAQRTKQEIVDVLAPFIVMTDKQYKRPKRKISANQATSKKSSDSRITLKDLIDADVLPAPLKIYSKYKSSDFHALITTEGVIEFVVNGSLQQFDSPSAAAVAATNKAQNGWVWWSIEGMQKNITLDYYRRKIIR